jgi:hypothetical protein
MIKKCRGVGVDRLRNVLPGLLASKQGQKKRPIILCTSKIQEMADLIEAMLVLLPPDYRQSVAFSTYEPDPYRLLGGDETADLAVNWVIGTIPQAEGGKFQFREDEFQTGFYVFDFESGRQSMTLAPSEYIRVVCDAVERSDWTAMERVQGIITAIGGGQEPAIWDAMLPAAFLLSDDDSVRYPEKWRPAIEALTKGCRTPEAACWALDILWRKSRSVLWQLGTETAAKLISGCRDLSKTAGSEGREFVRREKDNLTGAFSELLQACHYELATELLGLAGEKESTIRKTVIVEGLIAARSKGWPRRSLPERGNDRQARAFVGILDEGLHYVASDEKKVSLLSDLLKECFSISHSAGCFNAAWSQISPWLLAEGLQRVSPDRMLGVLKVLNSVLVKENEHEGRRKLALWELKNTAPIEKDRKAETFKEIATACRQFVDPLKAVRDTLSEVITIFRNREGDLIELFVLLFAQVQTQARDQVFKQYQGYVNSRREESARWKIRHQVSSLPSGQSLLAAECASMLFPWKPESAKSNIRDWIREVICSNDEFACLVSQKISESVKKQKDPSIACEILTTCIDEFGRGEYSYKKTLGILTEALVMYVPLERFRRAPVVGLLDKVDTSGWGQETKAFLQMAECYAQATRLPDSDCPDLSSLIRDYCELPRTISCLCDEHWRQSVKWIVSGLRGPEVEKQTSVASLMMLLISPAMQRGAGSQPSSGQLDRTLDRSLVAANMIIDQLRSELLQGRFRRDPSTHVCALSLFVTLAPVILRQTSTPHDDPRLRSVARIVGSILADDRAVTKRLLWQRLQTHQGLDDRCWQPWLRIFWKQVHLERRARRRQRSLICRLGRLVKGIFARHNRLTEQ